MTLVFLLYKLYHFDDLHDTILFFSSLFLSVPSLTTSRSGTRWRQRGSEWWGRALDDLNVFYRLLWFRWAIYLSITWHDMTWCDMIWYNMTWHDIKWYDVTSHQMASYHIKWHQMASNDIKWHGMAWHGMAWHGMAWHGMTRHSCSQCYISQ